LATQKANQHDGAIKFRKRRGDRRCQKVPFVCGERNVALFAYRKGEVDLMFVGGKWL
jgi:hypothetical protein